MDVNDVIFNPANMYSANPTERASIIHLVLNRAPEDAAGAVVVNGWHTSRSDKRVLCKVDYYDAAGRKLSRVHVVL